MPPKEEEQLRKNRVLYTKITFHKITYKKVALKEAIVTNNNIELYLMSGCFIEMLLYYI